MLQVRTYIGPSPIQGIGLFAKEFIPKDTLIWRFTPGFDFTLNKKYALRKLNEIEREFVFNNCSVSNGRILFYIGDGADRMNHSNHPNTYEIEDEVFAAVDIFPDREIVANYNSFDDEGDSFFSNMVQTFLCPKCGGVFPLTSKFNKGGPSIAEQHYCINCLTKKE